MIIDIRNINENTCIKGCKICNRQYFLDGKNAIDEFISIIKDHKKQGLKYKPHYIILRNQIKNKIFIIFDYILQRNLEIRGGNDAWYNIILYLIKAKEVERIINVINKKKIIWKEFVIKYNINNIVPYEMINIIEKMVCYDL